MALAAALIASCAANCFVADPPLAMLWRMLNVVAGQSTRTSVGIVPAAATAPAEGGEADEEEEEAVGEEADNAAPACPAAAAAAASASAFISCMMGSAKAALTAFRIAQYTELPRTVGGSPVALELWHP